MSDCSYKLSQILYGHTGDVRSICTNQNGCILSGSRDLSAKLWVPSGLEYFQSTAYANHDKFISSVCFIPPSENCPDGLVVTGSNDHKIRIFELSNSQPIRVISEHTNTVCKVRPSPDGNLLLSSSWDQTGALWNPFSGEKVAKFVGHSAAVWSIIQLPNGLVITGSADKTIRTYNKAGSSLKTLTGHTDCVRDLAHLEGDCEFFSVSNDATVRQWNAYSGVCLGTFYGHGHYIYSIAPIPGLGFVTSSEDRSVKVWSGGEVVVSFLLPVNSVWAVDVLPNSDIVTGCSDGAIRIFSSDASRQANAETLKKYDDQLELFAAGSSDQIGDIKLSELPGKEGLLDPGVKDGQTKIIREGSSAVVYGWVASESRWNKIGDVMGTNKGNEGSEKPVFDNKEYDFVFNVDIEEGKPPLKLPYNKSEDPWVAAQKFIHDQNLPQVYLEEVANFIITNSGQRNQPSSAAYNQSDFVDPFTGGARYVPTGNKSTGAQTSSSRATDKISKYFPQREFLKFEQANIAAIRDKIIKLNSDNNLGADINGIEALLDKCESNAECSVKDLIFLDRLLDWPNHLIFPVLDITRLLIKKDPANGYLCNEGLLQRLWELKNEGPNEMLALRILSNMFGSDAGLNLAARNRLKLLGFVKDIKASCSKHVQVAAATLLLNITVIIHRDETTEGRQETLDAWTDLFIKLDDPEAVFRALVALGTLRCYDKSSKSEMLQVLVQNHVGSDLLKVRDCVRDLLDIL